MSRLENKVVMGYFPFEERHYAALFSLVAPATPEVKLLDPFAGEGAFLEAAAQAWHVTPYANELDGERADACLKRFGAKQAVRCDAERLSASTEAFGILWANPPYDHDTGGSGSKRIEFRYLRHSWKWLQEGGIALWCVYRQHITEEAAAFLARHSARVDVWALPGKHLGEYDQIVVVAIKGMSPDPETLYDKILAEKETPHVLTLQPEPVYSAPKPRPLPRFVFAPDRVDEVQGLRLIQESGAWKSNGFQALLDVPLPVSKIEPVVAPRPGHMALVLAAGVANGAVIDTETYGRVALRGKTTHVEQVARVEVEANPQDPERQIKKTTLRLKPTTTLNLLSEDGTVVAMEGDEALLGFITANKKALAHYLNQQFKPMYQFDMNGMGNYLNRLRLKGKYPLYTAQQHVIAAVTRGFQSRHSILLVGQMGTGKTAMGSTVAVSIASQIAAKVSKGMRSDQVTLIVAPPHLIEKWKRELISICPNAYVEQLDRHEEVKAFMTKAEGLGATIPKVGLIKRDMTKLGMSREPAVVWRTTYTPRWRHDAPVPEGYTLDQRLIKQRVGCCPHCGETITYKKKNEWVVASETWLQTGKRTCANCHTPLWQDARDRGSQPKIGEKYPSKNPRYRMDEYIKRVYPDRVYLLIWDEIHEAAHGDTGNGEALCRLAGCAQKILALTGTPFNGRSSSMFNVEYVLNPRIREHYYRGGADRLSRKQRFSRQFQTVLDVEDNAHGRAESRWVEQMGVREQVVEERPSYDAVTGAFTGTSTYERPYTEAPGISPLLIAEILDHAIFFSLGDLGKALPKYEEMAYPIALDEDVQQVYEDTRKKLKDYLIDRRWEGDTTFRGVRRVAA